MTGKELKRIATTLEGLESSLSKDWGLHKLSGGYVKIDMVGFDDEHVHLTVKSGVESDERNDTTSEDMNLDRKTLKLL